MLLRRSEGMNRIYSKSALHRRLRAQARVGPLKLLHDEAVRRVAQPRTAVLFQVRSKETQRSHARPEVFWKFGRAMAGNDLGHDFLLHKTPHLIARRALVVREEFFDGVVIERGHAIPRCHLITFRSELKIAQRFNAGHSAFLIVESHWHDREFLSSLTGLALHAIT